MKLSNGASPLTDATKLVGIRLIVVVRVAIIQVHVPCIRAIVLRRRPEIVGRRLPVVDLFCTIFYLRQAE